MIPGAGAGGPHGRPALVVCARVSYPAAVRQHGSSSSGGRYFAGFARLPGKTGRAQCVRDLGVGAGREGPQG